MVLVGDVVGLVGGLALALFLMVRHPMATLAVLGRWLKSRTLILIFLLVETLVVTPLVRVKSFFMERIVWGSLNFLHQCAPRKVSTLALIIAVKLFGATLFQHHEQGRYLRFGLYEVKNRKRGFRFILLERSTKCPWEERAWAEKDPSGRRRIFFSVRYPSWSYRRR